MWEKYINWKVNGILCNNQFPWMSINPEKYDIKHAYTQNNIKSNPLAQHNEFIYKSTITAPRPQSGKFAWWPSTTPSGSSNDVISAGQFCQDIFLTCQLYFRQTSKIATLRLATSLSHAAHQVTNISKLIMTPFHATIHRMMSAILPCILGSVDGNLLCLFQELRNILYLFVHYNTCFKHVGTILYLLILTTHVLLKYSIFSP